MTMQEAVQSNKVAAQPTAAAIAMITAPRRVEVVAEELAGPGPGEVLVETLCSGISHGTEMNVYRGVAPQWNRIYDRTLRLFRPATDAERARPARGYWTPGDPTWTAGKALGEVREMSASAVCGSSVYMVGGRGNDGLPVGSVEIYTP